MMRSRIFRLADCLRDESAQVLPWLVLLVALFLGIGGLCVDLGHAYVCQRELQASTDAAALAGGYAMGSSTATTTSVTAAAKAYSSLSTGANANSGLPAVTFSDSFECLTTLKNQNILCTASGTGNNALQVTQTTTISTFLIQALQVFRGQHTMTSMTLTATATASMRGSTNQQYNVIIMVDTTNSMGQYDADASCLSSRVSCALKGVQTLLQSLQPCTNSSSSSSCTGFDNVSLFTFPSVQANTAQDDYNCGRTNPTVVPYTTPTAGGAWSAPTGSAGTYQVTGFLDNYSSTNLSGGALNTSSNLTIATGGKGGCQGLQTPGGDGTYFAGAIYAALSALNAEQAANPGSLNALIIESDGDAGAQCTSGRNGQQQIANCLSMNTTGTYPSPVDQCQQAITAAQSASSTTTVYTVAYAAPTVGYSGGSCSSDKSGPLAGISPCTTMMKMATSAQDFYSDADVSSLIGSQCTSSANPNLNLQGIFHTIATQFTVSRLIPNNTT